MQFKPASLLWPLLGLGALGACTSASDDYPSLALRPAERATGTLSPVVAEPYVPPPTPATVVGRLDQLRTEAASAHQKFLAAAPATRTLVSAARGAGAGSEAWARAQVGLAGLEAERSRAMIALADLDRLMVDAAVKGGELERIVTTRDAVIALVDQQNATIAGLLGNLR